MKPSHLLYLDVLFIAGLAESFTHYKLSHRRNLFFFFSCMRLITWHHSLRLMAPCAVVKGAASMRLNPQPRTA